MGWDSDIEELRRREALARQMGGPDKVKRQHDAGRLTVRERIAALLDPDSFHEIGALAGRAQYGDERRARVVPAGELRARARPHRRPAGRGRRRRFHGARRRGRCGDPPEAGDVGADGERAAHPARAPGRRHRRRRLGEDDRDDGLHLCAGQSGVGLGGRQHGHRAGRCARPWARSRASARRGS